jgi:hypothetical protein
VPFGNASYSSRTIIQANIQGRRGLICALVYYIRTACIPGRSTSVPSIILQSNQGSRFSDQKSHSFPRSVDFPDFCRKVLLVTTINPFRQRVKATFIRGSDSKNPAFRVLTEDSIT